jgi:hypothetical protein
MLQKKAKIKYLCNIHGEIVEIFQSSIQDYERKYCLRCCLDLLQKTGIVDLIDKEVKKPDL